ncbi:MAG: hypothetical protein HY700_10200 [Gemmatimonadetes bacterium]|nr:hypothetical protein [Gemmatimonadota bacterium]
MKIIVPWVLAWCISATPLTGQEPESLVGNTVSHGGFGGPVLRFTELNGQFGIMLGGHGGWIINHRFVIGGGAYGLTGKNIDVSYVSPTGGRPYLTFGYGGIELRTSSAP